MSNKITIVLADDHPIFRKGLVEVISEDPEIEIAAECSNGTEALRAVREFQPQIVILDIKMPGLTGFEVAEALLKEQNSVRIIFLTMYNDEEMFNKAMDLKAYGYVLKESAADDLLDCVHSVNAGERYLSQALTGFLLKRSFSSDSNPVLDKLSSLTTMEKKILLLVAAKKTSASIADELCISRRTVENHRNNICSKLNLHGFNPLLLFALENKAALEKME